MQKIDFVPRLRYTGDSDEPIPPGMGGPIDWR